ncbi:MAG TPA: hypothetical protein VGK55_00885 [Actinomycetes bacterium]|jgi:hypothetical protein
MTLAGAGDEFADDVVDHYLLELWPAPLDHDAIVRVGSEKRLLLARRVGRPPLTNVLICR